MSISKRDRKIAERLRAWRKHLGLTQQEFSDMLRVNIGVLRKYENAVNVPGGEALAAIGKTGVDLNWLVLGEGRMVRHPKPEDEILARISEIQRMLEGFDPSRRIAVLDRLLSNLREEKRLDDLERIVADLARRIG